MRSNDVQPRSLDSRALFFDFVDGESRWFSKQETGISNHTKHDNQNILFGQTAFPYQKSPNSKRPIKTVFKTASLQFKRRLSSKCGPDSKGHKEEAHKNTAAVKNKTKTLCLRQTLSWSDKTLFGGGFSGE